MKKLYKKLKQVHFNSLLMGDYLKRYNGLYLLLLSVVIVFELIMIIRGLFTFDFTYWRHLCYFISYFILIIASGIVVVLLARDRRKNIYSKRFLTNLLYTYSSIIISWATFVSIIDLFGHHFPIVYMTIVCIIGGVVVISPVYYISITTIASLTLLFINIFVNKNNALTSGDYINVGVFLVMSFIVTYRNYRISNEESHQRNFLEKMSYEDSMTGLLNRNSYFKEVDIIDATIKEKDTNFAVVAMDLNGLKAANDKYGHRYGSQLIIEAGKRIKDIFPNAYVYHVSGDEFVAIIYTEIFKLDSQILKFDCELSYCEFEFEGKTLVLSVARGYSIYNHKEKYNDTFQRADKAMYENKISVKEKFGLSDR